MQKQIKLRIVGTGVFTTIDKQPLRTVIKDRETKDALRYAVEKYNAKPSEFWMRKIMKIFGPRKEELSKETIAKKKVKKQLREIKVEGARTKIAAKTIKKLAKDIYDTLGTMEDVSKQAKQLKNVSEQEPKPKVTGSPFHGES